MDVKEEMCTSDTKIEVFIEQKENNQTLKKKAEQKVNCQLCNISLYFKNMKRHHETQHREKTVIRIYENITTAEIQTIIEENENTENTVIEYDKVNDAKNSESQKNEKDKFRISLKHVIKQCINVIIVSSFVFLHPLDQLKKAEILYEKIDEKKTKDFLTNLPFYSKIRYKDEEDEKGEKEDTTILRNIDCILSQNDKYVGKERTLLHLFNLPKTEIDLLTHVCKQIVTVSTPIFFNHLVLSSAKLKSNGKIKKKSQQMLPNCYMIYGYEFDKMFTFFEEIKDYYFYRLFNVQRHKRNNGRFSKIHYYKISDFDRILHQLSMVDEVYSKIDIKLSNNKWRVMYALFEKVKGSQYTKIPYFYGEKYNVNKHIVSYILKDILEKECVDPQDTLTDDDYNQLKNVLSNEFCTNQQVNNFYKETEKMIKAKQIPTFGKKRKRAKEHILEAKRDKKKKSDVFDDICMLQANYSYIINACIDEKHEQVNVDRKPGETYEKYEERFTKQQEMWKFNKYLEFKKEDQREFKKFDWNELEIKKENNTEEFEEAMQILDKCANIENNLKEKTKNTKCKTTHLNTEGEKQIKCLKVFTKVGDFKESNLKTLYKLKYKKRFVDCLIIRKLKQTEKKKSQTWSNFVEDLIKVASNMKDQTRIDDIIFEILEDRLNDERIQNKNKISYEMIESTYYIFKTTSDVFKASRHLDRQILSTK